MENIAKLDAIKRIQQASELLFEQLIDIDADITMLKGFKENWLGIDSHEKAKQTDREIEERRKEFERVLRSYKLTVKQIEEL